MVSDTARFEVVELATAVRLAQRLGRSRSVILVAESEYVKSVVAEVHRKADDLAELLRDVEGWERRESSVPADIRGLEDLRDDVALALRLLP